MMTDHFHFALEGAEVATVRLVVRGIVDAPDARRIHEEIERARATLHRRAVCIDLMGATHCTPAACRVLARAQRTLGSLGCRTAYLANRPRLRGVAWWIIRAAQDQHAMATASDAAAEAWLAADGPRAQYLQTRIGLLSLRSASDEDEGGPR